jgi:hypothetical protein
MPPAVTTMAGAWGYAPDPFYEKLKDRFNLR